MILFLHYTYRKILFHLIFTFCLAGSLFAQTKFTASASEKRIGLNDFVQIRYTVENAANVSSLNAPPFTHFSVISGPDSESGMSSINGKVNRYVAVYYILKPTQSGTFTLPAGWAIADGKKIRSNTVTIIVENQGTVAKSPVAPNSSPLTSMIPQNMFPDVDPIDDNTLKLGEDADEKIRKNLFVKMETNKTQCYVGEPVVVSFKIYSRLKSETNITDAPAFNGFSVSDMNLDNSGPTQIKLNGKNFNCYILRKVQLYPLQAGSFTLSPLHSTNSVTFYKSSRSSSHSGDLLLQMMQQMGAGNPGGGDIVEKQIDLASNPVTINVKPLPKKNIPASFKGAVGKFSIHSNLTKESFTTDDAGNLTVDISGSGNMNLINAPSIQWPSEIDPFDPKIKETVDKQQVPFNGSKTFNIPFTISKPGDYSIPPIYFSWFNPATGRYDSAKTEPIAFHVSAGKGIQNIAAGNNYKIAGLLTVPQAELITGIILTAGIMALILFFIIRKNKKEDDLKTQVQLDNLKNEEKEEFAIPGNPLDKAYVQMNAGNSEGFYSQLKQSLQEFLSCKLKIPLYELSKEKILRKLDECNVGIGTSKLLESIMQEIEMGLYARHSRPGQMREMYDNASELISLLNKQICD